LGYGNELVFRVRESPKPVPPSHDDHRPVAADQWRIVTSSSADPRLAIDGNPLTSWSSGKPQEKGQFFDVDLGGEYCVARIALGFVFPYSEFPRNLSVNGYRSSGGWRRLVFEREAWREAFVVDQLVEDPSKATMDLVLESPMPLERVRLFIERTETDDTMPLWRIPEIQIFEQVGDALGSCFGVESAVGASTDSSR
jgi:hypothetical protein